MSTGAAHKSNALDVFCIGSQVRQRNSVHVPASSCRITSIMSQTHGGQRLIRSVVERNGVVLPSSTRLCSKLQERVRGGIYRCICIQIKSSPLPGRSKCDGSAPGVERGSIGKV